MVEEGEGVDLLVVAGHVVGQGEVLDGIHVDFVLVVEAWVGIHDGFV